MAARFRSVTTARLIASFQRYDVQSQAKIVNEMVDSLKRVYDRQQQLCAEKTGRMKRLTRHDMDSNGLPRYVVGWVAFDFEEEDQPFYAPFPELGTVKQAAQPSLLPALFEEEPILLQRLEAALRS